MIGIYIDNNVWDFLFERGMDLAHELPAPEFCLAITREAEFEIPPIPEEKADLKAFIQRTVKAVVKTDYLFGFGNPAHPPNEQRVGGFDLGRFADESLLDFIRQQKTPLSDRLNEKTRLRKNEADLSIAARSFTSVVITLDAKTKGPINAAYKAGGKIVYLTDFDKSGMSLREFIVAELAARDAKT
ncbi:hypothetical protein SAMN04490192_3398 [Pseudomonas lundensis]|uniref:hypothetical protein n=1 Tax=Pseudomonas TaxID=286 RepID=UPI0008815045|nr:MULTISPECIES: hypothetical protein [Pseudomonas]MQT83993.1 hypothetical protein [Pseudomonas sp. FSL R10-2964]SDQ80189.1 hypothetical protein SAMN04490192_3398 [Pseudomonas lundensis]